MKNLRSTLAASYWEAAKRLPAVVLTTLILGCGDGGGDDFGPVLPGKLVYVDDASGKDRLYVSNADGRDRREIVIGGITVLPPHEAGEENLQLDQIASIGPPIWSPDHTRIAIPVSRSEHRSQLITVDIASGAAVTASSQLGELEKRAQGPIAYYRVKNLDWSPDGRYLVYRISEPGDTNPRLTTTDVITGEVQAVPQTADLITTAYSWDEDSTGLYIGVILPENQGTDIAHLEVSTGTQTLIGIPGPVSMGLSRRGGEIWPAIDPEYGALRFHETRPGFGTYVASSSEPSHGEFFGWFLSSPNLIAVEEIGFDRKPPLIARFDPASPPRGDRFDRFSVNAPVAFKWDFYATPDVRAE